MNCGPAELQPLSPNAAGDSSALEGEVRISRGLDWAAQSE